MNRSVQYMGLCVLSLPISLVMIERIYNLSYHHNQIGSMNCYPLFRVRSWNNGMRCMSLYILIYWISRSQLTGVIAPWHYRTFAVGIAMVILILNQAAVSDITIIVPTTRSYGFPFDHCLFGTDSTQHIEYVFHNSCQKIDRVITVPHYTWKCVHLTLGGC